MKSLGGVQRDGRTGSRDSYWPPFPHQPICTTAVVFFCFVFELTSLEFGSFCRILRFNDVQRTLFSCWPVDHIKPTWYSFCRANCRRTKGHKFRPKEMCFLSSASDVGCYALCVLGRCVGHRSPVLVLMVRAAMITPALLWQCIGRFARVVKRFSEAKVLLRCEKPCDVQPTGVKEPRQRSLPKKQGIACTVKL